MKMAPPAVVRPMMLELIDSTGAATPLDAELRYDAADPFAVSALFHTGDAQVRWVFSRELLAAGLYEPVGDGDVHVWPCLDPRGHAVVIMELSSPNGEALLQARSNEVNDFLAHTRKVVPAGEEGSYLDLDGVVQRLLDDAADTA